MIPIVSSLLGIESVSVGVALSWSCDADVVSSGDETRTRGTEGVWP